MVQTKIRTVPSLTEKSFFRRLRNVQATFLALDILLHFLKEMPLQRLLMQCETMKYQPNLEVKDDQTA